MNKVEVNRRNLEKMKSNGEVYKRRVAELEKEVASLLKKIAALQDRPKRRYTTPRVPRLKMCQGYVNRLENKVLLSLGDTKFRQMIENSNVGNKDLFMNPRYGRSPQKKKKAKTPSPEIVQSPFSTPSPRAKTPSPKRKPPVKRKTPPPASPIRRSGRARRAPQRLGQ